MSSHTKGKVVVALKEFKGELINPDHIITARVTTSYKGSELLIVMTEGQKIRREYSTDDRDKAQEDLRALIALSGGAESLR